MQGCNLVTLDELVSLCVTLLETDSLVREDLQTRYRYVLADDVHDCDLPQLRFLQLLTARTDTVFFAGDPNQSIDASRVRFTAISFQRQPCMHAESSSSHTSL